jgi:hypothetical protein
MNFIHSRPNFVTKPLTFASLSYFTEFVQLLVTCQPVQSTVVVFSSLIIPPVFSSQLFPFAVFCNSRMHSRVILSFIFIPVA